MLGILAGKAEDEDIVYSIWKHIADVTIGVRSTTLPEYQGLLWQ